MLGKGMECLNSGSRGSLVTGDISWSQSVKKAKFVYVSH